MPSIQVAIDAMRTACNVWSLGYDQSNRWDIRNGGEADCSSLVIWCLRQGGFDTGNATYTGNMSAELCKHGWVRLPNNGAPQPGDVLLNDADHVALYLGGGMLGEASIDERGRASGGQAGDQSGRETNVTRYFNFPWNAYLRYVGAQSAPSVPAPSAPSMSGRVAQHGVFTATTTVNIRRSPSLSGVIAGQLTVGNKVTYDSYVDAEGYRWVSYVGNSGNRNYVARRSLDNRQIFGTAV